MLGLLKELVEKPHGGDSESGSNQATNDVFTIFGLLLGARHFLYVISGIVMGNNSLLKLLLSCKLINHSNQESFRLFIFWQI